MKITYIHHSCFLVETKRFYFLFDYAKGSLPELDDRKPLFVLSSHGHSDHYNPELFSLLPFQQVTAVLSDDITPPANMDVLTVSPGKVYGLANGLTLTTFRSTDLGVAFLIEDSGILFYHAGDLNDWVWDEEPDDYNEEMTRNYRHQIDLLAKTLGQRELDAAFVVLDPRQEKDYDRGLCYFLDTVSAQKVYPMHYWGQPEIIDTFLSNHPRYRSQIQKTE